MRATAPATSSRSPVRTCTFSTFPPETRSTVGGVTVASTASMGAAGAVIVSLATRPWAYSPEMSRPASLRTST